MDTRRRLLQLVALCLLPILPQDVPTGTPPNVLIIVADDLGVDRVGAYGEHPDPGNTPVIDRLAAGGLLFRNCWSNPSCSPTRAAVLTGRHAHRTGLGNAITYAGTQQELLPDETTLAELLSPTYESWAVGKWHLATHAGSGLAHPLLQGFATYVGSIENLPGGTFGTGYFDYEKIVDGAPTQNTGYATTEQVDDALALIGAAHHPWFLWLAFNAPHAPFHAPPDELHSFNLPGDVAEDIPLTMKAMTEAMDTEIGRLLAGIDPQVLANTVIVFVGDNGTASQATTAPFPPGHAKGTVYEGGVRVPLIVSGPGVPRGRACRALVSTVDLFATVAEIAGVSATTGEDSVSLVPYFGDPDLPSIRDVVHTEWFFPTGQGPFLDRQRAVRGTRYKLVYQYGPQPTPAQVELFDLELDPFESANLLAGPLDPGQVAAFDALVLAMEAHDTFVPWSDLGDALAGTGGTPLLVGAGSLEAGETLSLLLVDAAPWAPAVLVVGLQQIGLPFKGGTMVPNPDWLGVLATNSTGFLSVSAIWPPGLPPGLATYYQYWIVDNTGPAGLTASNGVTASTPP